MTAADRGHDDDHLIKAHEATMRTQENRILRVEDAVLGLQTAIADGIARMREQSQEAQAKSQSVLSEIGREISKLSAIVDSHTSTIEECRSDIDAHIHVCMNEQRSIRNKHEEDLGEVRKELKTMAIKLAVITTALVGGGYGLSYLQDILGG